MRRGSMLLLAAVAALALPAAAQPIDYRLPRETMELKPAPGAELVRAHCAACHSLDYISTQPPERGQAFWQAAVTKMIRTYGAPVPEQAGAEIAAYLAGNY